MNNKLINILREFIHEEHHHIKYIQRNSSGEIQNVIWDPRWMKNNIICPGKKKIKHHICRKCNCIALHLFGKRGTRNRWCLECDGYSDVPKWYYKVLEPD